jgi:hypothetical protein
MIETLNPRLLPSEERFRQLYLRRKELGLTLFDLYLLDHLARLSLKRIYIRHSVAFLAETLHEPYNKVAAAIHKFKALDLVKKITFKQKARDRRNAGDRSGLVVSPLLVNSGNFKRRGLKVKVWNENKAGLGIKS